MFLTKAAGVVALGSAAYAQIVLDPKAVQIGSTVDGTFQIGSDPAVQAKSATSKENFINNCVGKKLQNGLQFTDGSCNGITMGDIPAKNKMMSSIITNPTTKNGASFQANQDFSVTVQMINIKAGVFTNAAATYYSAPQALDGSGVVIGHTHITIQDLGNNLNPTQPPDPQKFAFFKGINDAGNGNGLLTAVVAGGLPAGNYRVCTMASSANHQPALMPVAQRGTTDDCTKFSVGGNGGTINVAANNGSGGLANIALQDQAIAAGAGAVDPNAGKAASTTAKAAATSAANNGKGGKNNGNGGAATTAAAAQNTAAAGNNNNNNAGKAANGNGNRFGQGQGRQGQRNRQRARREFIA